MKQRRTLWTWLIAALLGFLLTLAAFHFDSAVQSWQHKHRWKNIHVLSRNVTHATDWPSHFVPGLLLAGLAWSRGNKKWTRIFLAMLAAAALAGITAHALKITTGRVRPSVKVEKVWAGPTTRQNFQSSAFSCSLVGESGCSFYRFPFLSGSLEYFWAHTIYRTLSSAS